MPYGATKTGDYTLEQAVEGIKGYDIPGPSGICTSCTVVWNFTNPPAFSGNPVSIIGYPGNVSDDGVGEAGALRAFTQDSVDPHLWTPGPIDTEDEGGWLGLTFRMDIVGHEDGLAEITLNCTMLDSTEPSDFPGSNPPTVPNGGNAPTLNLTDREKPLLTFTLAGDEDGAVIERSKVGGEFPWDIAGVSTNGTFQDNLTDNGFDKAPGTFTYRIKTFKLDTPGGPSLSGPTDPTTPFTYPESSTIVNMTGNLVLDMDWQSIMTFITDPSGIYTFVEGQTYDRLYNRGGAAYIDVKIPDPKVRIPEL